MIETWRRRRADTPLPSPERPTEDLTEAERRDVQEVLAQRYHGRKDRAAWDRRYWRGRQGQIFVRPRVLQVTRAVALFGLLWHAGCAPPVPRVTPADVIVQLVQFHGAVAAQYEAGGMELEHYNVVNQWIATEIRVLTTNSKQWEGQARLDWPRVKSICAPFEALNPWTQTLSALLQ